MMSTEPDDDHDAPADVADEPVDPLLAARRALERAAQARGVTVDEAPPRRAASRDPLAAAREALERAEEARRHADRGGTAGLAREAAARAQLEALKGMGPPDREPTGPAASPPAPKKRSL
jgi:hypothetical protein